MSSLEGKAYAIVSPKGYFTTSKTMSWQGPPKLYATKEWPQRLINNAWGGSQLMGALVVVIDWKVADENP